MFYSKDLCVCCFTCTVVFLFLGICIRIWNQILWYSSRFFFKFKGVLTIFLWFFLSLLLMVIVLGLWIAFVKMTVFTLLFLSHIMTWTVFPSSSVFSSYLLQCPIAVKVFDFFDYLYFFLNPIPVSGIMFLIYLTVYIFLVFILAFIHDFFDLF